MKATASNTSRQMPIQIAQRLSMARAFECTLGAGIMTANYKRPAGQLGWTTEQLVTMSKAIGL